jgi:N-formylglutamate deformylase
MIQTYSIHAPAAQSELPLVFDSPHSGMLFPADFNCCASIEQLKTGWDAFVEKLWDGAVSYGALLQRAHYSRMFIDLNRASDDIDPALLASPSLHCKPTRYSERGMGLIRRYALPEVALYDKPLLIEDIQTRVRDYYQPYHDELSHTLTKLHQRFGKVWHVNCHSMKSKGNTMNIDSGESRPDVILGDNDGRACDPGFVQTVEDAFTQLGYKVVRNNPYKGGYLVTHYAKPEVGRYSMQIEINRALYMHEQAYQPNSQFATLRHDLDSVASAMARYIKKQLQMDNSHG